MKLQINGEERDVSGTLTLAALIEQLGMRADRVAVELNREIVVRELWAAKELREGDRLEIVHFVGGGRPGFLASRAQRGSPPPGMRREAGRASSAFGLGM